MHHIYCITGADDYLREDAIEKIVQKGESGEDSTLTVKKLYGDTIEAEELDINLVSYSLFTEKKFIIVRNAGRMKSGCWERIKSYMQDPVATTTIILEDEKIDTRKSAIKSILDHAVRYDFPLPNDIQIMEWLRWYSAENGLTLSEDALLVLKEATEPKLRNYINEFEKIKLFSGQKEKLTGEDIISIVRSNRSFNIFEFTHALCEPDSSKVLEYLQRIFLFNESAVGILVMVTRHLILLLKIKLYRERGLKQKELKKITRLPGLIFNQYERQAARVSIPDLQKLLETVLETDEHLKTGYHDEKMALTLLIWNFRTVFGESSTENT